MADTSDGSVILHIFGDNSGGYTSNGHTVFDTTKIPNYKIEFEPLTDDRVYVRVYDLDNNLIKDGYYTYAQYDNFLEKNDIPLPRSTTFSTQYISGGDFSSSQNGNTLGKITAKPETPEKQASEADPAIEAETEEEESLGTKIADGVQLGLDVVGLIPVVGEIADGANALISLVRGDYVNAGLSAMAMIPFVGGAATGAKLGTKASKISTKKASDVTQQNKKGDGAKSEGKKEQNDSKCKIGPYSTLKCPAGFDAHHIIPDYTLRTGTRAQAAKAITGRKDRISPKLPTLNEGPCICLDAKKAAEQGFNEHQEAHFADRVITALAKDEETPAGTTTLKKVLAISTTAVIAVRKECAKEIMIAVGAAFGQVDTNMLVRATKSLPTATASSYLGTIHIP